ncbi:hypothetical protein DM02DRAFT_617871 [Periconia macrospinosa]|uniref:N-acetyltransferase domain-containing protein n=1 Tax=Periconia macrospinosa TaxID=97972 RepID=A0A2V1DE89_9PLEO|nr:hypothetical protein DM02DRAFT_617871 [Periconia macrospinosa]
MAEPQISVITSPSDFSSIFYCISESFGRQAQDGVWLSLNPKWETPEGQARGTAELTARFNHIKNNNNNDPNTVFLKATLPDPANESQTRIVGMAIWQQASFVEGYGDPPSNDLPPSVKELPEPQQRFARQMFASLWKRRIAYVREKAESKADPPAIFVLDMCCVDPAFQRRGIAQKLVEWGLQEAQRRGGLECTTEGSSMGRGVYKKLGFESEGDGDIVYEVDDEFKDWSKPPNVFLRTCAKKGAES